MAVKVNLPVIQDLQKLNNVSTQKGAGKLLVKECKKFILKGISPVLGERRFVGYKKPDKYPGDRKPKRPVNMKLDGDMLKALTYRPRSGKAFEFGWFDKNEALKAGNHNTGDTVPKRRLLPTNNGEEFNVSITRKLKDYYAKRLGDIIKLSK